MIAFFMVKVIENWERLEIFKKTVKFKFSNSEKLKKYQNFFENGKKC